MDINRTVNLALSNPVGAALGGQPTAQLTIVNDNSGVAFASPTYSVIKNTSSGAAVITLVRGGSTIGPASVGFTTTNGTATNGLDYTAVSNTVFFVDGQSRQTVAVPIINNGLVEGNRTVSLMLGKSHQHHPAQSVRGDPDHRGQQPAAGQFTFSSANYSVSETGTNAVITVVRTNGSTGQVSVHYATSDGSATAGLNYVATNGNLTYQDGVTSEAFVVPVLHDPAVTEDSTVNLEFLQPQHGHTDHIAESRHADGSRRGHRRRFFAVGLFCQRHQRNTDGRGAARWQHQRRLHGQVFDRGWHGDQWH